MSAMYHVIHPESWGYVHRAMVDGAYVEVSRRDPMPPLATIRVDNLTAALAQARREFGHAVAVAEVGFALPSYFVGRSIARDERRET